MWIRMHTTAAGGRLPHALIAGNEYDLDKSLAEELIASRSAEKCTEPKVKPPPTRESYEETAAENRGKGMGETAVIEAADKPPLFDRLAPKKK